MGNLKRAEFLDDYKVVLHKHTYPPPPSCEQELIIHNTLIIVS